MLDNPQLLLYPQSPLLLFQKLVTTQLEEPSTFHTSVKAQEYMPPLAFPLTSFSLDFSFQFQHILQLQELHHVKFFLTTGVCVSQHLILQNWLRNSSQVFPGFVGDNSYSKLWKTKSWRTFPASKYYLTFSQTGPEIDHTFFPVTPLGSYSDLVLFAAKTCLVLCSVFLKGSQNLSMCQISYETSGCRLQEAQVSSSFCLTCNVKLSCAGPIFLQKGHGRSSCPSTALCLTEQ